MIFKLFVVNLSFVNTFITLILAFRLSLEVFVTYIKQVGIVMEIDNVLVLMINNTINYIFLVTQNMMWMNRVQGRIKLITFRDI